MNFTAPARRARVVSTAMQKGGVGKTTSTLNLARAASLMGLVVLVVDLDPQGNTTDALGIAGDLPPGSMSVADALVPHGAVPLRDVIAKTIWPGVDLAPVTSTAALAEAALQIQAAPHGREYRLREAIEPVLGDYDLILIDNAPSLGLLLINALAADEEDEQVLVVMEADRWSAQGLASLRDTIDRTRHYYNRSLRYAGILISRWRGTSEEKAKLNDVSEYFPQAPLWVEITDGPNGKKIYNHVVPLWNNIKTEINEGRGLDESRDPRLRVLADTFGLFVGRLMEGRST